MISIQRQSKIVKNPLDTGVIIWYDGHTIDTGVNCMFIK
jgi:hypothetical protein